MISWLGIENLFNFNPSDSLKFGAKRKSLASSTEVPLRRLVKQIPPSALVVLQDTDLPQDQRPGYMADALKRPMMKLAKRAREGEDIHLKPAPGTAGIYQGLNKLFHQQGVHCNTVNTEAVFMRLREVFPDVLKHLISGAYFTRKQFQEGLTSNEVAWEVLKQTVQQAQEGNILLSPREFQQTYQWNPNEDERPLLKDFYIHLIEKGFIVPTQPELWEAKSSGRGKNWQDVWFSVVRVPARQELPISDIIQLLPSASEPTTKIRPIPKSEMLQAPLLQIAKVMQELSQEGKPWVVSMRVLSERMNVNNYALTDAIEKSPALKAIFRVKGGQNGGTWVDPDAPPIDEAFCREVLGENWQVRMYTWGQDLETVTTLVKDLGKPLPPLSTPLPRKRVKRPQARLATFNNLMHILGSIGQGEDN